MNERIKTILEGRRQRLESTLGRAMETPVPSDGPGLSDAEREHLHEAATDLYWNEVAWENLTDEERMESGSLAEMVFPGFLAFVRGLLLTEVMPDSLAPANPRPEIVTGVLEFLAARVVELEEQRDADDDEDPIRTAGELSMTDRLIDLVLFELHGIDPADVEGLGGATVPS
ncbi:MAG: hypothetical protein BMS9Abin29_2023 [Gemmatimonadota bacterium]|nr:MAG: hypothetical protein BMS9Abin29_2023 [Gemmatimonadota bacterium]